MGGIEGLPYDLPAESMLSRRRYAKQHFDHIRKSLMWEPRGHRYTTLQRISIQFNVSMNYMWYPIPNLLTSRDMYGCLLFAPVSPRAHVGVLFLHNEGFSSVRTALLKHSTNVQLVCVWVWKRRCVAMGSLA